MVHNLPENFNISDFDVFHSARAAKKGINCRHALTAIILHVCIPYVYSLFDDFVQKSGNTSSIKRTLDSGRKKGLKLPDYIISTSLV